MSSRDGFSYADIDTGYLDDPKVRALVRHLIRQDTPELIAPSLLLHLALILGSWDQGRRVDLEDAVPLWWTGPYEEHAAALRAAGLIDEDGRVPARAWANHHGPPAERRNVRRLQGQIGGLMSSLHITREEAIAEIQRREAQADLEASSTSGQAEPDQHLTSGQPDRSDRTDRPAGPSDKAEPAGLAGAREAQPPADADAPAAATEERIPASIPWWPGGGASPPSTLEEAQTNLRTVIAFGVSGNDARRRQAESKVRSLLPSNGSHQLEPVVGDDVGRLSDGTVWCRSFRAHQSAHRDVSTDPTCDRCAAAPILADVL